MTEYLSPSARQQFFNAAGDPLSGGLLFTYLTNTITKANTFSDSSGVTPNTNPIVLDSTGSCDIWLPAGVLFTYTLSPSTDTDPPTNPFWTRNNIGAGGAVATINFGTDTGIVNSSVATVAGISSLFDGLTITLEVAVTNTGPVVLNLNSLGPKAVVMQNGAFLVAGQFQGGGQYLLQYTGSNWQILGTSITYGPFDARLYGAKGNASTDDSAAIGVASTVAQAGFYDAPITSWIPNGGFKIANPIDVSYLTQGQVNYKGAKFHGPGVLYPVTPTYVFQLQADNLSQQNTKFILEDFIVVGDGANTPSFMYTASIAFSEIRGVSSYTGGSLVDWNLSAEMRAQNCWAFHGTIGFKITSSHDTYVTECHAFGNSIGMQATGTNNVGTDGNNNFVNCASHGNSTAGFFLKGLYTPNVWNVVTETQPTNLHFENVQYGITWGAFCGPTSGAPNYSINYAYTSGLANYGNIIGAINAQNEMQLTELQTSILADSIIAGVPSTITGASLSLGGATFNNINGLNVRGNTGSTYDFIQDATSGDNIINGGRYEKQIYLQGTKSTRGGGNVIMPNLALGGIKTDDSVQGQFALNEYVRYFDGVRINESAFGYLLPYTAQTGTIAISSTATFDVTTLVPAGAAQGNAYEAEFMVFGGGVGSTSVAKVLVLRSLDSTVLAILAGGANHGTLSVTVATSIITVTNNSGVVTCPYVIKLTKLAGY